MEPRQPMPVWQRWGRGQAVPCPPHPTPPPDFSGQTHRLLPRHSSHRDKRTNRGLLWSTHENNEREIDRVFFPSFLTDCFFIVTACTFFRLFYPSFEQERKKERKSYWFRTTWGCVNKDRIFNFAWITYLILLFWAQHDKLVDHNPVVILLSVMVACHWHKCPNTWIYKCI